MPVPCERIPLETDWPGWWAKLEIFQITSGPVLYIDLDSVIVGPLEGLFRKRLTAPADFNRPLAAINGSVLAWDGDYSDIMRRYDPAKYSGTDQRFIEYAMLPDRVDHYPPGLVVSFKNDCRDGPPEGASIVQFHGKPKMPEVKDAWVHA